MAYRNNLKNREFDKEAPQNSCPERVTIAGRQGASEDKNFEEKPTPSKTDSSSCFGITGFVSFEKEIRELLNSIVERPSLHGLWINTLSYLENCGARMIAACEHPTLVKEEMLKHAAEEFRHAFYLKKQLVRIGKSYEDYQRAHLLGAWSGYHYLNKLDIQTSRYLQSLQMTRPQIKQLAYLLVTYAIELRAAELYPLYQAALKHSQSKVQVQSILLEEKEHLREMEEELNHIPASPVYIEVVCRLEAILFGQWVQACQLAISGMQSKERVASTISFP